jgi:hypothetical protein
MKNLGIIIIEKSGTIKTLCVKEYNESDLYNNYLLMRKQLFSHE